jgi:outer membrane protein OmpA-like peptidoglycan-associated protein
MHRFVIFAMIIALFSSSVGCSSAQRRVIGGTIGGEVGAVIGRTGGGARGSYIGNYMDKQAEEMQADLEGAKIERVGEGIKITFDSGILFDVDKATLKPEAQANLDKMAAILNKYPDTNILIEGHTDATGSEEHNLDLSRNRAQSVSNYIEGLGVNPARFTTMGYGESQPVATNDTDDGRQQNRRVELFITANDKLKKAAQ